MIELLVVIAIIAILASLLLPSISRAKASAISAKCKSNLHQIGIALTLYVQDFGSYPAYFLSPPGYAGPAGWTEVTMSLNEKHPFLCPSRQGIRQFDGQQWFDVNRPYGYNAVGYVRSGVPLTELYHGLAGKLGPQNYPVVPVKESDLLSPSEMIAIGDGLANGPHRDVIESSSLMRREAPASSFQGPPMIWDAFARSAEARHGRRANIGFADAHVEALPLSKLFLDDSDARLRQWNRDHQPHR